MNFIADVNRAFFCEEQQMGVRNVGKVRRAEGAVWAALLGLSVFLCACAQGTNPTGAGGGHSGGGGAATTTTTSVAGGSGGVGGTGGIDTCVEPEQTPGDCKKKVCQNGTVVEMADNTDLPNDNNDCTTDACVTGMLAFTPLASGAPCASSGGKVCDGAGKCVACVLDANCAQGEACSVAGTCVSPSCVDGVKNGDETDLDCGGMCGATCQPGQMCLVTGDCELGKCEGGVCVYSPCANGVQDGDETDVDCGGSCALGAESKTCGAAKGCQNDGDCTGGDCQAFSCVPNCFDGETNGGEESVDCGGPCAPCLFGTVCASPNDCLGGPCVDGVCCDDACLGLCRACSALKKGSGVDGECGNVAPGTDPDNDCFGATSCGVGQCQVANGQMCSQGTECQSGFCVDGVCCNTACSANCQACSTAKKGAGANGTCGNIVSGSDPDNECFGGTACNGVGACALLSNGTSCTAGGECQSGFCVDGVCCNSACDTECQACTTAKKGAGTNGTCGTIQVGQDPDDECPGALVCASGGCKLPNGEACFSPATCVAGFCVDGVCCNAACTGACLSCLAVKKGSGVDGTCGSIGFGLDPDDECGGTTTCSGAGACALYADGVFCAVNSECVNGHCVDGVCCNTTCTATCQACSAAKKNSGVDGVCGNIMIGLDPDNECPGATSCGGATTCSLFANGSPCNAANECVSNQCVDGVCCNTSCTATCQACTAAKKGTGASGTCGSIVVGSDPDNECAGATNCSGGASCALFTNGTPCAVSAECSSGQCVDGVCCNSACSANCQACTALKKGSGTDGSCGSIVSGQDPDAECAGTLVCNGSGVCKQPTGLTCMAAADCLSGFCVDGVCCNASCTGTCQACTATKKGSGADGTCGNIAVNSDPDMECGGAANCNGSGACALFAIGAACTVNAECSSTFCVDGVCCNTSCTTNCQACTAAKKGSGTSGTCGVIATGTDPDSECPGAQVCNGASVCKSPAGAACGAGAECLSGFCADGVCCNAACGGTCQACTAAKKGSGADGTCGNIAVNTDPDNECFGAISCSGSGTCSLIVSGPCTNNAECQSGFCTDGVCCNTACASLCQACTAVKKNSGADGTCGNIATNTDPDNECAGATLCSGAGTCALFTNGTACGMSTECQSGNCVDGVCCNLACGGTCQACTAAKKGSGTNGTCGNIALNTDPDLECPGATTCNGMAACSLFGLAASCGQNGECASGFCSDGICCSSACSGLCEACVGFKTGVSSGTCAPVVAGTDPDDECDNLTSSPNCGGTLMCGP